jgi:hypothetical protein
MFGRSFALEIPRPPAAGNWSLSTVASGRPDERFPVPRVWRPLAPPGERDVAQRETCRLPQPAERDLLDQREDVALEGGEVDELAVLFVPLPCLALAGDVGFGPSNCCGRAVRRIGADRLLPLVRREPGAMERLLVLLPLVVGKAVIAVDTVATRPMPGLAPATPLGLSGLGQPL